LLATQGRIVAQGTPAELMDSMDPETRQFVRGEPDGPVKFHYPAPEIGVDFGAGCMMDFVARLGATALEQFRGWGHAAFFFLDLLRAVPASLRRFGLVVAQVHAIGNRSLVIIMASGLAVGFVLALQMYYALVAYGAAESLGLIVNLALVRELGPVVTGLLFAGRAGTSLTAEIGLMKAGEQIAAMELMAIDPKSRVLAPRLIGGIVSMPILAVLFSAIGILGAYVVAVLLIGVDAGQLLVHHADQGGRLARRGQRPRQGLCLRRGLHRGGAVPGF
jgi:phospholipid/cholesterol/gamma-HCH transport system permease protein